MGGSVAGSQSKDPSLFRDDAAAIRGTYGQPPPPLSLSLLFIVCNNYTTASYIYSFELVNSCHTAKLKQQAREETERMANEGERERGGGGKESILHQMKRERDYRRRRQKYRARNVHITRRTPAQVCEHTFQSFINFTVVSNG